MESADGGSKGHARVPRPRLSYPGRSTATKVAKCIQKARKYEGDSPKM